MKTDVKWSKILIISIFIYKNQNQKNSEVTELVNGSVNELGKCYHR